MAAPEYNNPCIHLRMGIFDEPMAVLRLVPAKEIYVQVRAERELCPFCTGAVSVGIADLLEHWVPKPPSVEPQAENSP